MTRLFVFCNTLVVCSHDFDFGLDNLHNLAGENNFPWLMSNVVYKPTGRQLADGIEYKIIEWEGRKIGIMGLVEWEWMVTPAQLLLLSC